MSATREFLMYADGINVEKWIAADTQKEAHKAFWSSLSHDQRNGVESIECVDERIALDAPTL